VSLANDFIISLSVSAYSATSAFSNFCPIVAVPNTILIADVQMHFRVPDQQRCGDVELDRIQAAQKGFGAVPFCLLVRFYY
jgi:hypothetical protein